jgi:hypothetical protein
MKGSPKNRPIFELSTGWYVLRSCTVCVCVCTVSRLISDITDFAMTQLTGASVCSHCSPQLLLDYLPLETPKWDTALHRKRTLYQEFIQELILDTHNLAHAGGAAEVDPLGLSVAKPCPHPRCPFVWLCPMRAPTTCDTLLALTHSRIACVCLAGALASDPLGALGGDTETAGTNGAAHGPTAWCVTFLRNTKLSLRCRARSVDAST